MLYLLILIQKHQKEKKLLDDELHVKKGAPKEMRNTIDPDTDPSEAQKLLDDENNENNSCCNNCVIL